MQKEKKQQICEWITNVERIPQEVINQHFLLSIENDDELMELYLLIGANPNVNNNQAMSSMAKIGNLNAIKLLHEYGGDVNIDLTEAIKENQLEVVKYMFEQGAEMRPSYLEDAILTQNCDMIQLQLDHNAKVTDVEMRKAVFRSVEIVKQLLPYTGEKFPAETFHNGDRVWGYIEDLPYEGFAFVLDILETRPDIMSYIIAREDRTYNRGSSKKELKFLIGNAFNRFIENANYEAIQFLVQFYQRNNMSFNRAWNNNICNELLKNSESLEELGNILNLLKKHGIWKEITKYSKFSNWDVYKDATIEKLKILDIPINRECFKPAIDRRNEELVKTLLDMGIQPIEEDINHAFKEYRSPGPYGRGEVAYRIAKMLAKNEES